VILIYLCTQDNTFSRNTSKMLTFSVALGEREQVSGSEQTELAGWILKKRRKKMQGNLLTNVLLTRGISEGLTIFIRMGKALVQFIIHRCFVIFNPQQIHLSRQYPDIPINNICESATEFNSYRFRNDDLSFKDVDSGRF
jgi:hypothetical protein